MRNFRAGLFALLLLLLGLSAGAHPMGNFSINHYAHFVGAQDRLSLRYVLDLAEIPTIELRDRFGTNNAAKLQTEADALRRNLTVTVDGRPLELVSQPMMREMRPGAGGLQILRLTLELSAPLPSGATHSIVYADANFPQRTGWKEIIVTAELGATICNSTAPATDRSDELRVYPVDANMVPPQQTEAHFTLANAPSSPNSFSHTAGEGGESPSPPTPLPQGARGEWSSALADFAFLLQQFQPPGPVSRTPAARVRRRMPSRRRLRLRA